MGESLFSWTLSCNGSVCAEPSGQRTTSDSGALLLPEARDTIGVIKALEDNLVGRRHPLRILHSLASQLRTLVLLQHGMGWTDISDTGTLRRDPLFQLACSDARGMKSWPRTLSIRIASRHACRRCISSSGYDLVADWVNLV